jgi:hypothetical protein
MDVVLAFGGGGVKGAAHVGVLRVLEREDSSGYCRHQRKTAIAAFYCAGSIGYPEAEASRQNHLSSATAMDHLLA